MAIARVFKSGNSQAVRLPKKFRVKSSEVEIFRRGDEIVLREKARGMVRVLDLLAELPADMFPKKRKTAMKKPKYGKQASASPPSQTLWKREENKAHGSIEQKGR